MNKTQKATVDARVVKNRQERAGKVLFDADWTAFIACTDADTLNGYPTTRAMMASFVQWCFVTGRLK